ncbi:MAG: hypothetical protein FWD14_05310 [Treponema sp.]|nr:hypothetical protein [Treponema sp.]
MEQRIHISNVDNSPAMCFDTGLDPRSFARTKMSQSLIEQGYVVSPDGSHEIWRASGVNETNGSMRVYGPLFQGKRLDILLNSQQSDLRQAALEAVVHWIKAKLFLGDTHSALNPGASFVDSKGGVFFSPEHLSNRCLYVEGTQLDRFNCPDLTGMDTAAFCAGVMLYQIFSGVHPYPSAEIYQDMREGIFMPVHLAIPNLDNKLAGLIQSSLLLPVPRKRTGKSGTDILTELLNTLTGNERAVSPISSLYIKLPAEKTDQVEREKRMHSLKQNSFIRTKRFVVQNRHLLTGISVAVFFILFIVFNTASGLSRRPTTEGMSSEAVVKEYYEAFSALNHFFMEACIQGADKSDLNAAISLFAIVKARQANEMTHNQSIIQARTWREAGGELPAPNVFGVTDLTVVFIGGSEDEEGIVVYRAEYLLWSPNENFSRNRSDVLTLRRDRRGNWRIIEIIRTER